MDKQIVTRFAPSPTGYFHVGSGRVALFNYVFAKQNGGKFLLRIEDTDKERSEEAHTKVILEGLEWMGLKYDNDPVIQSQNAPRHKEILEKLIADGFAYEAEESEGGNGKVIRFKNPNKEITFSDLIRGDVTFDTTELKDFVIAKNINEPIFHLAVVVDDFDMGVTHIIRGDDHISNTPRQILIQEAIGAPRPIYGHMPLILAPDRSKLSKRRGAKSVMEFKEDGYLPEALVNYLALIGWHPNGDEEIFSIDELIKEFSVEKMQKGGAIFSLEKLLWVNKEHLKKIPSTEILERFLNNQKIKEYFSNLSGFMNGFKKDAFAENLKEKISLWKDLEEMTLVGEFDFIASSLPKYDKEKLVWKQSGVEETVAHLRTVLGFVEKIEDDFNIVSSREVIWPYAEEKGKGAVLWPVRYALTGKDKSPDPFNVMDIIGKEKTIERLEVAIDKF